MVLEGKYNRLPLRLQDPAHPNRDDRRQIPETLQKLQKALLDCCQSRQIEDTVRAVKKNLDILQDGLQRLGIENSELTDGLIAQVKQAHDTYVHCVEQLRGLGKLDDLQPMAIALYQQLQAERMAIKHFPCNQSRDGDRSVSTTASGTTLARLGKFTAEYSGDRRSLSRSAA